jgi:hypothetical protein
MAHIKLALPVLEGYGPGKLFIVADPSSEFGREAAVKLGGEYLGGDIVAAHAATVDGRGDTILIGPGDYTLTTKLTVSKDDVSFIAAKHNATSPTVTIKSALADTVEIEASHTYFKGIKFQATDAACEHLVNVADTKAVDGLTFEECVFDPNAQTTVTGITADDASFAVTGMTVANCTFLQGFDGSAIEIGALGAANSLIENNFFQITAAKDAINLADTTAFATGYGLRIKGNTFLGGDATGDEVAITIAGTENTTAPAVIEENKFLYCATAAVTIDKITGSIILNYQTTDQGNGGTLVDPST